MNTSCCEPRCLGWDFDVRACTSSRHGESALDRQSEVSACRLADKHAIVERSNLAALVLVAARRYDLLPAGGPWSWTQCLACWPASRMSNCLVGSWPSAPTSYIPGQVSYVRRPVLRLDELSKDLSMRTSAATPLSGTRLNRTRVGCERGIC